MQKKILEPGKIGSVLKDNISRKDVVFVFSTDISMNSWAEWCIKNPEESGVKAVGMNHFMAWDTFKREFVVARESEKHAVPALLRKIFVTDLLHENDVTVASGKEPLFKSLISKQFASDGYAFADWISGNLTSLKNWYQRFCQWSSEHPDEIDDEDRDYLLIYNRYVEFLGDKMFEPSWVTPDFSENTKKFIIFYPEQLADFDEYESLLTDAKNVEIYTLPESESSGEVYVYPDARQELRRTALQIRKLVEKGVPSEEIALHVPDLETYKPYILREFNNYCITFVLHFREKLTVSNAGSIFENISQCFNSNYSYDSIRSLVMNSYMPWKEPEANESLVRVGQELHLICNYKEGKTNDVWYKALKATENVNEREFTLYNEIRKSIESFYNAGSFAEVQASWFAFKKRFFDEEKFDCEEGVFANADKIIARCVKKLEELIDLEQSFIIPKGLFIKNYFEFFLNEIRNTDYVSQNNNSGVDIYDYRVGACSAFKYNFVINCSQNGVSVMPRKLGFLNSIKREKLGITDKDTASAAFLKLYGKFNSENQKNTIYSCSENSFSGYAIPHNSLKVIDLDNSPFEELDSEDFIVNQRNWFLSGCTEEGEQQVTSISENQKKQLLKWKERNFGKEDETEGLDEDLEKRIKKLLCESQFRQFDGAGPEVIKITQTDMENFFPCPRKWILGKVLNLKDETLEAELFNAFDKGNICHKILELLFEKMEKLPVTEPDGTFGSQEKEILSTIFQCTKDAIYDKHQKFKDSPIVLEVLNSQMSIFVDIIISFLRKFCENQDKNGFGGCKVHAMEKSIGFKPENKDYGLSGKIDCILTNDNDEVIIVDFKTQSSLTLSDYRVDDEGLLKKFQTAMYVSLWNGTTESVKVYRMDYFLVFKCETKTIFGKSKPTAEEYQNSLEAFNEYSDLLYQKVTDGRLKPVTRSGKKQEQLDVYEDCKSCNFNCVCRSTYTVAGNKL